VTNSQLGCQCSTYLERLAAEALTDTVEGDDEVVAFFVFLSADRK
jgi:hypothetical protein